MALGSGPLDSGGSFRVPDRPVPRVRLRSSASLSGPSIPPARTFNFGSGRSSSPTPKVKLRSGSGLTPNTTEAPKPKSFLEQINPLRLGGQFVQGIGSLTREVIEAPVHMARLPIDIARELGAPIPGESALKPEDLQGNIWQDIGATAGAYSPLVTEMTKSIWGTADVLGATGPNIIERYREASEQGNVVDTVLQDAGNIALVAGPASRLLGRTARVSAGTDAATRFVQSGRAGVTQVPRRSLSSAAAPAERTVLPPRLPGISEIPNRIPGTSHRTTVLRQAAPDAAPVQPNSYFGTGLAGYLERQAMPGASPAQLYAARVGRTADNPMGRSVSEAAQRVETVGEAVGKAGLGAQWVDPSESLFYVAEKALGRAGSRLAKAAERAGSDSATVPDSLDRASRRIDRYRQEGQVRQDVTSTRAQIQKAALRPQVYVDRNLSQLGIDQAQRDILGGVILDATDLALDSYADTWRMLPEARKADMLRQWNARRPHWAALTAERLDRYNDYRDGKLSPEVTEILTEGLDQVRLAEEHRRWVQQNAGNLLPEQLDPPEIDLGNGQTVPYWEATKAQRDAAIKDGTLILPWLESKTIPELEARQARVEVEQAKVDAARVALNDAARQVDLIVPQRKALPKPGRNVPWGDTPEGRAEIVGTNAARVEELQAVLEGGDPDAIRAAVSELLVQKLDEVDPVIGTNPTPPGQWSGEGIQNFDQGVVSHADAVAEGPPGMFSDFPRVEAERLIRQEIEARVAMASRAEELRVAEWHLSQAEKRVTGFYDDLDQSQMDMVREVSRGGVHSYRRAATELNDTGVRVGSLDVDAEGNMKLTGLVAKMATELGIYDQVLELAVDVRRQLWGADWARMSKQGQERWGSFERFVDVKQLEDAAPGQVNIAVNALNELAESLTGDAARRWELERSRLERALIADDLDRFLAPFQRDDAVMGAHAAYTALMQRIEHMPEALRKQIGNDFYTRINDEYAAYRKRFNAELSASVNRNLSYVPAIYRTPLQEARRMNAGLLAEADRQWALNTAESRAVAEAMYRMTEHAPTSFSGYVQQNRAVPIHLIAGDGSGRGRRARPSNAPDEAVVAQPRAGREREVGARLPTLRAYSNLEAREMTMVASQQSVLAMANDPTFSRSIDQVPGVTEMIAEWERVNARPMPFSELEKILREADPNENWVVVKNATPDTTPGPDGKMPQIEFTEPARMDLVEGPGERRNLVAVTDPVTGDVKLVDYDEVGNMSRLPDIRVVPDYIAKVLDDFINPRSNTWLTMYDQMVQLWKTATLAWSVAWVTYNAVGNALMATFSYGQSPVALVRNMSEIRKELRRVNTEAGVGSAKPFRTAMKNDTLSALVPSRMGAHGPSWAERMATMQVTDDATRLGRALEYVTEADRSWIGKLTEFSYTLNEFTDNMFRTSVLMDDVHKRLLREAPLDPKYLNDDGTLRTDLTPDEHRELTNLSKKASEAIEASTRAALNTMGDFTRLTRFERNVVKRIFPFYPWLRHQTAMTFRIPLTNPLRWAWAQSLADVLATDDEGEMMRELMSGMVPTPWGSISLAAANPFGKGITAFGSGSEGSAIFDPKSMLSAISPVAKFPVQQTFGIDLNQAATVSRPPDQKYTNEFGQQVSGSALSRILGGDVSGGFGELGYNALGLVPQSRGLRDTVLGPQPRYDSGDVITYAEDRPGGRLASLARAARVPFVPTDISYLQEVAAERDQQALIEARRRRLAQLAASNG